MVFSQELSQEQAMTLLQAWQTEVIAEPYRADVKVEVNFRRKDTFISQEVSGWIQFGQTNHGKSELNITTNLRKVETGEASRPPYKSKMASTMDGEFLWTRMTMGDQEMKQVLKADLKQFQQLLDNRYSGVLGLSLPFLSDPRVLTTILSRHRLTLTTNEKYRVIETKPRPNLLGSFNLPPITRDRHFRMTFPAEGFYPLTMEVITPDEKAFQMTISEFKRKPDQKTFSFSLKEDETVADPIKTYERYLGSSER
jgi:hypothetical protein